jgi:hypothetical protein
LVIDPDGEGPVRAFDPCLWLDPDNRLWFFWSQGTEAHTVPNTLWAMRADQPDLETPRWTAPNLLGYGILMNKPLVLSTGEWLLPVAVWKRNHRNATHPLPESEQAESWKEGSAGVWRSRDRGASWQILGAATVSVPAERCCDEHMLLERSDGTIAMWVRTRYGIGHAFSRDRGCTWSAVYPSALAHTASRFFVRRPASGNLLLVKHGPLHTTTGRSHLTAYLSADEGASWSGGLLLDERTGVSYPDATQGPDGLVRLIYDFDRKGAKQILMARFTEDDIVQGRPASPGAALRLLVNQAFGKP